MFNWTSISDITEFIFKVGAVGIVFHFVIKNFKQLN